MAKSPRYLHFLKSVTTLAMAIGPFTAITHAAGTMRDLSSMQIVQDMAVGWNLGNTLDAFGNGITGLKTETYWGVPKTSKSMFDTLKTKSFKTFRIPVTWVGHFGAAPDYVIEPEWLDRVEEVVNYALDGRCYVILNSHHDEWVTLTAGTKAEVQTKITKIWTQIANRFKDYDDHLIFESLNEPRLYGQPSEWNGGTPESRSILNEYNAAIVAAMRATGGNNSLRHIMIPTYSAASLASTQNDLVLPANDARIIVSQHMYSPYYFTLDTSKANSTAQWGSAGDKSELDAEFDRTYNKFVKNGIPVVIGEWGSIDKGNLNARVTHADYFVKAAKQRNMAPVWWDNNVIVSANASFSILDRKKGTWSTPELANAITGPWQNGIFVIRPKSEKRSFGGLMIQSQLQTHFNLKGQFLSKAPMKDALNYTVKDK